MRNSEEHSERDENNETRACDRSFVLRCQSGSEKEKKQRPAIGGGGSTSPRERVVGVRSIGCIEKQGVASSTKDICERQEERKNIPPKDIPICRGIPTYR